GIAPRLRKPLPDSLGSRLLRFIAERTGPSDRQWVYVKLGEGELAPWETLRPSKRLFSFAGVHAPDQARARIEERNAQRNSLAEFRPSGALPPVLRAID